VHLFLLSPTLLKPGSQTERQLLESEAIAEYQRLITLLPPASRYLLLYLLDFLSVFVRSSSANLMTASNLAVVFQPGLVSTRREGTGRGGSGGEGALLGFPGFVDGRIPDRSAGAGAKAIEGAGEHGRGKEVLEFLIEQQASFMLGLEPPLKGGGGRRGKEQEGTEDSGYGNSGSSPGSSGGVATPKGTARGPATAALGADLSRRGSEKSVERRRLRKSHDGENGKVKRSRTLPVNGGVSGREGSEGIYRASVLSRFLLRAPADLDYPSFRFHSFLEFSTVRPPLHPLFSRLSFSQPQSSRPQTPSRTSNTVSSISSLSVFLPRNRR
jgi:hypothetical protein